MTDATSFRKPRLRRHPRIWLRSLFRGWTFAVWLAAAVLAVYLASMNTQFGEIVGVIETVAGPVAPLETARLSAVHVTIGQRVKTGDIVATLDTALVDAELRVAEVEMAEARDTLSGYQRDMLQMVQKGESAILDAETAMETLKIEQARDAGELAELKQEQRRREELLAKRLISEELASQLRPSIAALEGALAAGPALIRVQERRLELATKERKDMRIWMRVDDSQEVSAAIQDKEKARGAIADAQRDLLELRRKNFTLRATRDGTVSTILHNPGDIVAAGDPVLQVIPLSDAVAGFLPEIQLAELTVGQRVWINRMSGRGLRVGAVVESIGPEVQTLPGRISPIRGQPLRGRRVMLKLEGPHDFIPGETVKIGAADSFRTRFQRQVSHLLSRQEGPSSQ
jgi:multidrug resistance efflux pump